MKKNISVIVSAALVIICGLVVAINRHPNIAADVVNVGVILPLSGPMAYEGERLRSAMELAIANDHGKRVVLRYGDGKYAVRDSINAFRQLQTAHKIDVWVVWADLPLMGMREMLAETGKPIVCLIGAQGLIKNWSRFIHFSGSIVLPAKCIATYAAEHGLDSVAVIYHKEDVGEEVVKAFRSTLNAHRASIVSCEGISSDNVDVKSIVAKAIASKPKAIFVYAYGPLYISILNQIKNQKYDGTILADSNISAVRDKIVDRGLGIVYGDFDFGAGCQNPETKKFISDMEDLYHVKASSFSAFAFETIRVLCAAVDKYGTSPDAIERGFYAVQDYPSIVGRMTCRKNDEQIIPIVMKRIDRDSVSVLNN